MAAILESFIGSLIKHFVFFCFWHVILKSERETIFL